MAEERRERLPHILLRDMQKPSSTPDLRAEAEPI